MEISVAAGDRIKSVTISFEHMVYEDALTILSYASPYEVIIQAKNGKLLTNAANQGAQPGHPLYKSASIGDLLQVKPKKFQRKRFFFVYFVFFNRLVNQPKNAYSKQTTTTTP